MIFVCPIPTPELWPNTTSGCATESLAIKMKIHGKCCDAALLDFRKWCEATCSGHLKPKHLYMFIIVLINHQHRPDHVLQNFLHGASFFCQAKWSKPQFCFLKGNMFFLPTKNIKKTRNYPGSIQFPLENSRSLSRFSHGNSQRNGLQETKVRSRCPSRPSPAHHFTLAALCQSQGWNQIAARKVLYIIMAHYNIHSDW